MGRTPVRPMSELLKGMPVTLCMGMLPEIEFFPEHEGSRQTLLMPCADVVSDIAVLLGDVFCTDDGPTPWNSISFFSSMTCWTHKHQSFWACRILSLAW
jgi:hypothetical protein